MNSLVKVFLERPSVKFFAQRCFPIASRGLADEKVEAKRPASSFGMYLKDRRASIIESNPSLKSTHVMKIASEQWNNETYATQYRYKTRYQQELNRFKQNQPVIPKGPPRPFMLFSMENSDSLKRQYPNVRERTKAASEMWSNLSDVERDRYSALYKEKLSAFNESLTEEDKLLIQEKKEKSTKRREKREIKKYGKSALSEKPVPPANPWIMFMREQSTAELPEGSNRVKVLSERWKALGADEKEIFELRFTELKEKYEEDLLEWQKSHSA